MKAIKKSKNLKILLLNSTVFIAAFCYAPAIAQTINTMNELNVKSILYINSANIGNLTMSKNIPNIMLASYDVNERIKKWGGGPFCINRYTGHWVIGKPRQLNFWYPNATEPSSCAEWAAGQMMTDRRYKKGVSNCTCIDSRPNQLPVYSLD